ncbi:hypothetical protein TUBRATIS_006460 [Tubulinosema ratisbonensis]|uniref:Uncharacterized protein n=1 Tax=Tubulinosema ratisbonensis TaxID=291195 RepID=A0A437ANY6_9MICR|nr:hypothetical protein TUBRATIS_006460 [Tubulinosema ratisbonensis]
MKKITKKEEGNILFGNIMQLMFRVIENQTNQNDAVLKLLTTHKLDSYNDSFHSFLKFLFESPLFIYFNLENTIAKDSKVLILEKYFDEFYLFQYQFESFFSKLFNLKTLTVGDDFDLIVTELITYIINLIQKNDSFFILPELIHHKRSIIKLILKNPILLIQLSFVTYKIMVLYLNFDDFFTKIMIFSKDNPESLKIIEAKILEIRLIFFYMIGKPLFYNEKYRKIYKIKNFLLFLKVKYYDVFVDLCDGLKIVPYNSRFVLKTLNDGFYHNVFKYDVDYIETLFKNFQ